MAGPPPLKNQIIDLSRTCLDPNVNNDIRRLAQNQLDALEQGAVEIQHFVAACNSILLDVDYVDHSDLNGINNTMTLTIDAVSSYCGNVLPRMVASGRVPVEAIEYAEMHVRLTRSLLSTSKLAINRGEPPAPGEEVSHLERAFCNPLRKLHCVALSRVVLACAKLTFPDNFPTLFEPFFFISANGSEQCYPKPLLRTMCPDAWLLVEFYISKILAVDELNPVPRELVEQEKRSRMALARVTASVISVLFSAIETAPAGVDSVPIQVYQSLLSIVEALIPSAKPETLADRPAMLITYGLRRTSDADEELVGACGSLFAAMCGKKGVVTADARQWIRQVIDCLDGLLAAERWNAVTNVIEGFEELPMESLQEVAPEVSDLVGKVLRTRSLFFSHRLLPILNRLVDSAQQNGVTNIVSILPEDLVHSIFELCPRNKSQPRFCNQFQSARMSEMQFLSEEQYDQAFQEFRSASSKMLRAYAELAPQQAAAALMTILKRELRPPGDNDVRNEFGHVTQQSAVFFTWDACLFCVEHLAHCFESPTPFAAGPVQPVWDGLVGVVGKNLTDAVLLPSYLKMMSSLWVAPDVPWVEAIDLLMHYATVRNDKMQNLWDDRDLVAARRRALTLLVSACTHHGERLVPMMDQLRQRMHSLWMSNQLMNSESNHLLEAATALSCFMKDSDQAQFLNSIVQEPIQRIIELGRNMTPVLLRDVLFEDPYRQDKSQMTQQQQNQFKHKTPGQATMIDDLSLVTGVLRRCSHTLYARNAMGALIGPVTQMTSALHELHATAPPQVMAAFEVPDEVADAMSGQTHRQYAPGQGRNQNNNNRQQQPHVDPTLKRIRGYVQKVRECAYQLVPIAMKIFGSVTPEISRCLEGMRIDILPFHVVNAAVKHLFTQAVELYPPCTPLVLRILLPLFVNAKQRTRDNPVYVSRQLFFIYKDFMTAVRAHVLQKEYHKQNREVCMSLVEFFSALVTSCPEVTLSGCRDASSLVVEIMDDGAAGQLYLALCRAIGTTGQALSRRDLEAAGDAVFSVYHKNFDRFSVLLQRQFPPNSPLQELLVRFHTALRTIQRFPPRRNRFIEFCQQMCQ